MGCGVIWLKAESAVIMQVCFVIQLLSECCANIQNQSYPFEYISSIVGLHINTKIA